MTTPFVSILMGSDSDWPTIQNTAETLKSYGLTTEVKVLSAHRTPHATAEYVENATQRGCHVFICAAGLAAHLAGAVSANTIRPVIGIPMDAGPLQGMDALLSTVQMPAGLPVATMAIGKAGAVNAGHFAAQIIALTNPEVQEKLVATRKAMAEKVLAKNEQEQFTS